MNQELTNNLPRHHDTYDERIDKLLFTLRGQNHSAENLAKAKKAVDCPPSEENKPFKPFETWHRSYGGLKQVTVTSMTESGRFWITTPGSRGRKERSQAGVYELYPCDAGNDAVIAKLRIKEEEIQRLREQTEAIRKELRNVEPKDWEETE